MALTLGTLLFVSIGFSLLSLNRLQTEFEQYQVDAFKQGQQQFDMHQHQLTSQLRVWLESFADIMQFQNSDDFGNFASVLSKQFDGLQLHLGVESLWLVSNKQEVIYASSHLPDYAQVSIANVLLRQEPISQLHCDTLCKQFIAVPVLNQAGEIAVVALTASLADMLYSMNSVLKSDIAIVSINRQLYSKLADVDVHSSSNPAIFEQILAGEEQVPLRDVEQIGLNKQVGEYFYLFNLLPLSNDGKKAYYLAMVGDLSTYKAESDQYRDQFLMSVLVIFVTLMSFIFFVASPFTKRLLRLSNALPLLAKKEFAQFREARIVQQRLVHDELDIVTTAAQSLSYELEQLNIEVEQKTKELENIAMYDLLTGLPNRNMLNYQLRKTVAKLGRYEGSVAVLFLDLDDFKKVNDSHGHSEGDRLLIEAANRIRLSIREFDLACRFGGDEFVVILSQINAKQDAIDVAERILANFKEPIRIGTSIFYVSTSIGLVYSEEVGIKADDLVSFADIAMYEAKEHGGGQLFVYHDDMYQRVAQRVMLESEVRQALAKNQFSLSLQPQLEAKTKKLFGFEALLRWHHPERGMVSPDDFIPILENSEHMIELGYWVIRHSVELLIELKEQGLEDIKVAINLSADQFLDPNLANYLIGLMNEFRISASHFELELTEQTLVKDIEHAINVMKILKDIGFSFAIDDFGTGYSSLAYLKRMPVDVIKIDKSFIFGMLENHADYQIIMSTIAMVKNLGLTVVAEGVETGAQLRHLRSNDCDIIQGYYFSKPVPEAELAEFVDNQIVDGYWKTEAK